MSNNKEILMQFQMDVAKNLKGEPANIRQYFTNDAQWHLPASLNELCGGSERIGIDQVMGLFEGTVAKFYKPETMNFESFNMISEGAYAHIHFIMTAKTVNDKDYKSVYQTLYRLEEDKIAEVWESFDSGTVIKLLES